MNIYKRLQNDFNYISTFGFIFNNISKHYIHPGVRFKKATNDYTYDEIYISYSYETKSFLCEYNKINPKGLTRDTFILISAIVFDGEHIEPKGYKGQLQECAKKLKEFLKEK
jgi:hypothetical protein